MILILSNQDSDQTLLYSQRLWKQLLQEGGPAPDSVTYNRVLRLCAKSGHITGSLDLLNGILRDGNKDIKVGADCFLALLEAFMEDTNYQQQEQRYDRGHLADKIVDSMLQLQQDWLPPRQKSQGLSKVCIERASNVGRRRGIPMHQERSKK